MPYKDKSKQQAAQRKYNAKRAGERTRGYATIVYPESASSDWKEILADLKIQVLISPLHDQDVNPTGEPKKPHYHVMLMFEGPKSSAQAKAVIATFGGIGCEVINSTRGYARYLCHLDNPEKHRYSPSDVQQFGGVDYQSTVELASDLRAIGKEIRRFISKSYSTKRKTNNRKNECQEFSRHSFFKHVWRSALSPPISRQS